MRQSACLVFNPITIDNYASFFSCTPVGGASDSMMVPTILVGCCRSFWSVALPTGVQLVFSFAPGFSKLLTLRDLHRQAAY